MPLQLVTDLLSDVQETDKNEENYVRAQQLESVLKKRDSKLIDFIRSLEIEKKQFAKIKKHLSDDRELNQPNTKLKID